MINVKMHPSEVQHLAPKIAVIGVGGAGGNAVNNMISSNLDGCEFLVCNTDAQALDHALADNKVQLGTTVTGGLGAGSNPEVGKAAAEESLEEVLRYLDGANMAFVTAGMGGGTGTGAAPVIAKACREQGILTVGVVTKPFHFEGVHRMKQAEEGIKQMQQYVDTLIVIPNQNLFRIANEKTTFAEAFKMADTVLQSGVRGVTDLMVRPGLVNLDFADIRTAMLQMGKAMMGTGEATGDKRAVEAAEAAINNPLLDDVSMKGARGVIINVTGGYDMTLFEADEACNRVRDEVDPNANIIFGATFDDNMEGYMRVSIVATGIETEEEKEVGPTSNSTGGTTGGGPNGGTRLPLTGRSSTASSMTNATQSSPVVSTPSMSQSSSDQVQKPAAASLPASGTQETSRIPLTGRDMIKGLTAPSPITQSARSVPAAPVETKVTAPSSSLDMFEQAEFVESQQETVEVTPRATTYKDSFIPPKPLEPDMKIPENGIGSYISSFHGEHVPEKAEKPTSSSLFANPPKMKETSSPDKPSRAPSLFERITGSVQNHIDNFRDDNDLLRSSGSMPNEGMKKAVGENPSQGRLDIAQPSGKPAVKIDEELDIPAFLRRQAN